MGNNGYELQARPSSSLSTSLQCAYLQYHPIQCCRMLDKDQVYINYILDRCSKEISVGVPASFQLRVIGNYWRCIPVDEVQKKLCHARQGSKTIWDLKMGQKLSSLK